MNLFPKCAIKILKKGPAKEENEEGVKIETFFLKKWFWYETEENRVLKINMQSFDC